MELRCSKWELLSKLGDQDQLTHPCTKVPLHLQGNLLATWTSPFYSIETKKIFDVYLYIKASCCYPVASWQGPGGKRPVHL